MNTGSFTADIIKRCVNTYEEMVIQSSKSDKLASNTVFELWTQF